MGKLKIILAIINAVTSLKAPPPFEDETALRQWVVDILELLKTVSSYVPGETDDKVVAILAAAVADDGVWTEFYSLFKTEASGLTMSADFGEALGNTAGLTPVEIIEMIALIVSLWRKWREER